MSHDHPTMLFEEVVGRSVYGSTGFVGSTSDLAAIEQVIEHNLPVLQLFRSVAIATNFGAGDRAELSADNARLWRSYLPDCVLIDSRANRGHSIGTADLDNLLFEHCRQAGAAWLCKGANDVRLSRPLLSIPIEDASFYYLNAVSYDAIRQRDIDIDIDIEPFLDGFFFPQTTFYALEVSATDYLVAQDLLDRSYEAVLRIPDYNDRIWEHLPGWSCERLLGEAVLRNGLRRCSLASDEQWRRLVDIVVERRITDCSFKGLEVNGICHLDFGSNMTEPLVVVS